MDLADATLMLMTESAGYPSVARLAESAYLELVSGRPAPHHLLAPVPPYPRRTANPSRIDPLTADLGELRDLGYIS
jgi:hypothetical protein